MEKQLIENWINRFSCYEPFEQAVLLNKKSGDTFGEITVELSTIYAERQELTYKWSHELYTLAKETLENENWLVHSAFIVGLDVILLLKKRSLDNFYLEADFADLREDGNGFCLKVTSVAFEKLGTRYLYQKDVEKLKIADLKDKTKELEEFLYHFVLKKSPDRLRFLSGSMEINRDEAIN